MSDLPKCEICGKQIVNAPAIGWYCPTMGCEGDWPQKMNIVFDHKTDAQEQQNQINKLRLVAEYYSNLEQGDTHDNGAYARIVLEEMQGELK